MENGEHDHSPSVENGEHDPLWRMENMAPPVENGEHGPPPVENGEHDPPRTYMYAGQPAVSTIKLRLRYMCGTLHNNHEDGTVTDTSI